MWRYKSYHPIPAWAKKLMPTRMALWLEVPEAPPQDPAVREAILAAAEDKRKRRRALARLEIKLDKLRRGTV